MSLARDFLGAGSQLNPRSECPLELHQRPFGRLRAFASAKNSARRRSMPGWIVQSPAERRVALSGSQGALSDACDCCCIIKLGRKQALTQAFLDE
jgi:hypothetical protein